MRMLTVRCRRMLFFPVSYSVYAVFRVISEITYFCLSPNCIPRHECALWNCTKASCMKWFCVVWMWDPCFRWSFISFVASINVRLLLPVILPPVDISQAPQCTYSVASFFFNWNRCWFQIAVTVLEVFPITHMFFLAHSSLVASELNKITTSANTAFSWQHTAALQWLTFLTLKMCHMSLSVKDFVCCMVL